jgi:hypothetical protein
MLSNRLAFIGLGFACILAAFGGGYLASRQNTVPVPAAALESTTRTTAAAPAARVADDVGQSAATGVKSKASQPAAKRPEQSRESALHASQATPAARTPNTATQESVDRTPPANATSQSAAALPAAPTVDAAPIVTAARINDRTVEEPPRAPEPPEKTFVEVVVPANNVIGLQTENRLSSETAHVEDRVEARVMRDVKVGDQVAIPAGARAIGSVTQVEIGGKFKERAHLSVRFHTLVLADGTRLPINTETINRDGEAPGDSSATKIGGAAVAGTIIGAILGGGKGAAAGAAAGAGGGAAAVAAGDRKPAILPAGLQVTVRLQSPVTVTLEK